MSVLVKSVNLEYLGATFDIELNNNVTIISGNSGVGKTLLYRALLEADLIGKIKVPVIGLNYLTKEQAVQILLNGIKESLIIIDNAELVLNEKQRKFIANDTRNQYIIFAHDVYSFWVNTDSIGKLVMENGIITLKY